MLGGAFNPRKDLVKPGGAFEENVESLPDEPMTLYVSSLADPQGQLIRVVANMVEAPVRIEVPDASKTGTKQFISKSTLG